MEGCARPGPLDACALANVHHHGDGRLSAFSARPHERALVCCDFHVLTERATSSRVLANRRESEGVASRALPRVSRDRQGLIGPPPLAAVPRRGAGNRKDERVGGASWTGFAPRRALRSRRCGRGPEYSPDRTGGGVDEGEGQVRGLEDMGSSFLCVIRVVAGISQALLLPPAWLMVVRMRQHLRPCGTPRPRILPRRPPRPPRRHKRPRRAHPPRRLNPRAASPHVPAAQRPKKSCSLFFRHGVPHGSVYDQALSRVRRTDPTRREEVPLLR